MSVAGSYCDRKKAASEQWLFRTKELRPGLYGESLEDLS